MPELRSLSNSMNEFRDVLDMRRLMFCVLERGLKDIIKWHHPQHSKNASFTAYDDSIQWILGLGIYSGHDDHVFSFVNICDCLSIPHSSIKNKIINIVEGKDDVPEQLLGGSLWKHGHSRSTSRGFTGYSICQSSFLLLCSQPFLVDEEEWHGFPERETIDTEDCSSSEEDDDTWDKPID